MLVNYTQESFTGGVSLAGGVAALVLMVIVSYFFSWDHDSEHSQLALVNESHGEEKDNTDDGVEESAFYSFPSPSPVRPHSNDISPRSPNVKSGRKGKNKSKAASDQPDGMVTPFKADNHYLSSSSSEMSD